MLCNFHLWSTHFKNNMKSQNKQISWFHKTAPQNIGLCLLISSKCFNSRSFWCKRRILTGMPDAQSEFFISNEIRAT